MKSPSCLLLTIMFMLIKHSLQIDEKHRSTKEDIQMKLLQPLPSDIDSIMTEYGDDEAMKDLITRLGAVSMFSYPAPAGPAIGIVLTLFVEMLLSYRYKSEPEAPIDTKKFTKSIRNLQTFINKESDRVIEKLEETIYDEMLLNKFRNSLNSLNSCHKNNCYNCFVKRNCSSDDKKYTNESLINPTSPYRLKLSELIPNFIQSQETPLDDIESPMRIFDYIIWKHKLKKNQHLYCNNTVSEHKKIVQIAQYVSSILSKSYSMVIIANLENYKLSKKNNDTIDANGWIYLTMNLINNYYRDVKITLTQAQRAINETSRDIRPCDPDNHERGVTYEPLVHFIQADLYSGCYQHPNSFNCDNSTNINTMYYDSNDEERNVEYYAVDEGPTPFFISIPVFTNKYGKFESNKNLTWKKWHIHCKTEICYDDKIDSKITVRKFSLNIAKASNGYVVTGVRLAVRNRTIYVDIQEGLFVDDVVDPQSVRWKNTTGSNDNFVELNQYQRIVSIDDIYLPKGSYVNGVKFEMNEKIMTLRVYGINENGSVIEKTPRLHMLDLRYYREEIKLENPDVSELMPSAIEEQLIGKPGKSYVRFQPTDFFKDAGQTTVPYLDIQPVVTNPPSPIQGIGVYYKGHKGYGGFIGLKLLTVDISDKLNLDTVDRVSNNVDDVLNKIENEELNIQLKEEVSARNYNDDMMIKYNKLYNQYYQ